MSGKHRTYLAITWDRKIKHRTYLVFPWDRIGKHDIFTLPSVHDIYITRQSKPCTSLANLLAKV